MDFPPRALIPLSKLMCLHKGIRAQQEELMATKDAIVGTLARVGNTNTV
jgi:hypothetical protein